METHKKIAILFVAMFLVVLEAAYGQTICNMTYDDLMACEPSAKPPNPPPPSAACCVALAHADIPCLCSYKNSNELPALGVDPGLAMMLPAKCKLPPAYC